MRRYEIDWIRNISILMLFVYHTCAIFCIFGDFYIVSQEKNLLANLFIILMCVWYMPMLFFLAGASTYFSSKKRSFKQYLLERIKKLFIPFLFGIIFLVPPQTYLARLWRGESNLNYFEHLKYFFTTLTDFSGFDGAFTPAHLWFILYLFIVSIVAGIIIFKLFNSKKGMNIVNILTNVLFNKYCSSTSIARISLFYNSTSKINNTSYGTYNCNFINNNDNCNTFFCFNNKKYFNSTKSKPNYFKPSYNTFCN